MPNIFSGNNLIKRIFVGSTAIKRVFLGPDQVWPIRRLAPQDWIDTGYLVQPVRTNTVSIGAEESSRIVLLAIGMDTSNVSSAITNVTIAGITATLITAQTNGVRKTWFYRAAVPTGTTAQVVITSSNINHGITYGVYSCTGVSNFTVPSSGHSNSTPSGSQTVGGLTWAIDDFLVAVGMSGGMSVNGTLSSSPAGLVRNATVSGPTTGTIRMTGGRFNTNAAASGSGSVTCNHGSGSATDGSLSVIVVRLG